MGGEGKRGERETETDERIAGEKDRLIEKGRGDGGVMEDMQWRNNSPTSEPWHLLLGRDIIQDDFGSWGR